MRFNRSGGQVADSLYSQLKHARQVATTGDATAFGVEIGIVTNVKDPDKQGRVKVCYPRLPGKPESDWARVRSEEHTSELQSRSDLVCRLLLEKKNEQAGPALALWRAATDEVA